MDRFLIDVGDSRTHQVFTAALMFLRSTEQQLGVVRMENLIMGMQHELGVAAALTMSDETTVGAEIAQPLLSLSSMAMVYLKALIVEQHNVVDDFPTSGQG